MLVKVGQPEIRQALQYLSGAKKKKKKKKEEEEEEEVEEEEGEDLLVAIGDLSEAESETMWSDSTIILVAGSGERERETDRKKDRQKERQTDRQTERMTVRIKSMDTVSSMALSRKATWVYTRNHASLRAVANRAQGDGGSGWADIDFDDAAVELSLSAGTACDSSGVQVWEIADSYERWGGAGVGAGIVFAAVANQGRAGGDDGGDDDENWKMEYKRRGIKAGSEQYSVV